jgi:hypothetical protein
MFGSRGPNDDGDPSDRQRPGAKTKWSFG